MSGVEKQSTAPLETLATEINAEHQSFRRAFKATYRSALRAGDLLNEAKAKAGHGNWAAWVEKNCEFSDRTARVYMRLANNRDKVEEMLKSAEPADLSIEGVLRELATPKPSHVATQEVEAPDGTRTFITVETTPSEREPASPMALEDALTELDDDGSAGFYERSYQRVESKHGREAAEQWIGERVREREDYRDRKRREEYEALRSKPEYVALKLYEVVSLTTARFEDIPQKNPLPGVMDDFEWRQVLAHIERWRDSEAARWVEVYATSGKGRGIDDLRRALGYVLRYNEYADIGRIEEDARILREAGKNFAALASALETAMKARTNE